MRAKGIKGVKGVRNIKGIHDIRRASRSDTRSGQLTESSSAAKQHQLDIEKANLEKVLEQFERQKAQIEKRLSEINQATASEVSPLEEMQRREMRGESNMPEKDDEPKKKIELDFGIGKISFGDLFQGIESFMDLVSRLAEEGKGEERHEGEFTSPSGRIKAVYGFSIKEGLGGKPLVEPFGNMKRTPQGPVVKEEREPLVDVFDEKDHVSVIIELPGVEVKDLHTEIKGDILTLSATSRDCKYAREVVLPKDADTSTATSKYKNGILEIRMSKK